MILGLGFASKCGGGAGARFSVGAGRAGAGFSVGEAPEVQEGWRFKPQGWEAGHRDEVLLSDHSVTKVGIQ